jgi:3-hydroxyacyl-CoA dehydrogenase/enoyl-CoA hydratase/3-hydroxybutyryl-CoA epimerase
MTTETLSPWALTRGEDGIATLVLDVPGKSANTLGVPVLEALAGVLDALEQAPPRGLLIKSGKPSGFVVGADINEFARVQSAAEALVMIRRGQQLFSRLEALPCPTAVLLHGYALGGGLELALACRYRIGVDDGRLGLGLPEVLIGIHPGFGGSVRAIRLLGVRPAMDLMLTGKTARADRALKIGLVDALAPTLEAAEALARQRLSQAPAARRPSLLERALSWPGVRNALAPALVRQVARRVRREHYPAPYALVELWRRHGARGAGVYEAEAQSLAALFESGTARQLVRVFQLQDRLKALGAKAGKDGLEPARRVHVVGAGVMGGDIAAWCALRGLDVTLQDRSAEVIEPALRRAHELFDKRLRDPQASAAAVARLHADVEGAGVATADVVIEAIFEDRDAKRALFAALEPRLKPGALLATNTSSLVLESLADALTEPSRLIGLHFFNPVAQMPLVEVVRGTATPDATLSAALAFVRQLDRLPLPCRSAPGFLVNRALAPYLQEALLAVEEGIAPELVDLAATRFGMPMGPIELADVVGLEVCRHVGEIVTASTGRRPPRALSRLDALIAAGKLGRKRGEGFYRWQEGKAIKAQVRAEDVPADLQDRLVLALVNECRAALREGVVDDADLVDAGLIFGAGFAPFRGGPLAWAREQPAGGVAQRLAGLATVHGARFTPDADWTVADT